MVVAIDSHHRKPKHGGENPGGEEIEDRLDIENRRVAGHAFMHSAENTRTAGAKQYKDRHKLLGERLLG